MAYREVHRVESREVIRRWQVGLSQRRIAGGTGVSRPTVRRYIEAAGLKPGGPEPSEEQLAALATLSSTRPRQAAVPSEELLAPWAKQIEGWLTAERLQVTRVQELLAERGCEVSCSSLRRFIARRGWGRRQPVTVRMEDGPPDEVAELDFGRLGLIPDPESGRRRTVWALIVVWRYSRHCFVWPTTSQRLDAHSMLAASSPDRIDIAFDDHRLVADAGLLLPATLAGHLGLQELADFAFPTSP